jgi:SSS family solute:Na+ symporter
MTTLDWLIVIVPMAIMAVVAYSTHRYVKGVADFMAGNRCAGRYVIANARGEMGMAVVGVVAGFEAFYQAGFAWGFWEFIRIPVATFITLLGFVVYRYRETRALSLAQFFEMRYSKSFRLFAGILAFISGTLNYGIFPAVSARFFVYFCGLPSEVHVAGCAIPTFAIVMVLYLSVSLFMTLSGGQLTVMVTDCIEGLLSMWMFWVVSIVLLVTFSWKEVHEALALAPAGRSMMHPFDAGKVEDFNLWYILIGVITMIYGTMAWQGAHAYNSSAASPHETKMANVVGSWRGYTKALFITMLSIAAYTFLVHPDFAGARGKVDAILSGIDNPQIVKQMRMPVALGVLLPIGVKGVVCSVFFMGLIACDSSYQHSWGSIFVQDVIVPLRKRLMTPAQHIRALRLAIAGVALFGFVFSLFFRQTDYILMFFAITGAIYLGGAGAAIIGGLYWKKGTTGAAFTSMITGALLAAGGILLQKNWGSVQPWLLGFFPDGAAHAYLVEHAKKFPINGQWMNFIAMGTSMTLYIVVSLLTCKADFNMDRMLHRGAWAKEAGGGAAELAARGRFQWSKLVGVDGNFDRADKALSYSVFGWKMLWFVAGFVILAWNLVAKWPLLWWSRYWFVTSVVIPLVMAAITSIWFTWGGVRDLRRLFASLRVAHRDARDDGTVVDHHNLDDPSGADANGAKKAP